MKRRLDAATFSVLLAGCGGGSSEPKGTDATRADAAPSGGEDAVAGGAPADAASGGTPGDAQGGGSARDANAGGDDAALTDATPAPNDGPADDASQSADAVDVGPPPPPPQDDNGLVINEFMASNKYTLRDAAGSAPDWVELYNGTDHALQLGGYIFSTDPERIDPALAFVLPDELSIEPGAYLVLRFDPEADPAPDRVRDDAVGVEPKRAVDCWPMLVPGLRSTGLLNINSGPRLTKTSLAAPMVGLHACR
jgi:hypothetical protein